MIRLFACDLDGTLLNQNHEADDIVHEAIHCIINNEKYFAIATGRHMHVNSFDILNLPNVPYYTICMNGAMVLDPDHKIIYEEAMNQDIVRKLLEWFPDIAFECVTNQNIYIRDSRKRFEKRFIKDEIWDTKMDEKKKRHFFNDFTYDCSNEEILNHTILKMNFRMASLEQENTIKTYLKDYDDEITMVPFGYKSFEITSKKVNKGTSVKWLADYLKIPYEEVAVYGDGENDVEMLAQFQNSYATENAVLKAKKASNHQLGTCKDYAVPYHIIQTIEKEYELNETFIERVNTYDDSRFKTIPLIQHGCFLVDDHFKYQFEIIDDKSVIVTYDTLWYLDECIEAFRFYSENIAYFYDEKGNLLRSYPEVDCFEVNLKDIQPSQFYVDHQKLNHIQSFIQDSKDIIVPLIPYLDRYVSLDGHTRLYSAYLKGESIVSGFIVKNDSKWINDFVKEARKRGIYEPKDLILLSHEEYDILWNQYCEEYFKTKE